MAFIIAVRLSAGGSLPEHITHVMIRPEPNRQPEIADAARIVALLRGGSGALYVRVGDRVVAVSPVVPDPPRTAYLRTAPDDTTEDNLLSLPRC